MPIPLDTQKTLTVFSEEFAAFCRAVAARLPAVPPPVVPPVVPPPVVPPPAPPPTLNLLGGWRLVGPFSRGTLAIDFATMRATVASHEQRHELDEYDLPAMGSGADVAAWPAVSPSRTIPAWSDPALGYVNGLCVWRGKRWVSSRVYYDASPTPTMKLHAEDGETIELPIPTHRFGGFVKRGPGLDPLLGCGGNESGQGQSAGPTLATLDGQPLISYGWEQMPGDSLENWDTRAPREPNYYQFTRFKWTDQSEEYKAANPRVPHPSPTAFDQDDPRFTWDAATGYWKGEVKDDWPAWNPRTVNGTLQGRWACDRVAGGGIVRGGEVLYWAWVGTGRIDYFFQNYTLSEGAKSYLYRYDATTHALKGWSEFPVGLVKGQEIDAQGRVYLCVAFAWDGANPAIYVYG